MLLKIWRLVAIMLAPMNMAQGLGHLLQLPPKMRYDAVRWRKTQSIYLLFGPLVGASIEGGAPSRPRACRGSRLLQFPRGKQIQHFALRGRMQHTLNKLLRSFVA
jgi:hypothetical protein